MLGFNTVSTLREQGWEHIQSFMIESMRRSRRNLPLGSQPYSFQRTARGMLCAIFHRQGTTVDKEHLVVVAYIKT